MDMKKTVKNIKAANVDLKKFTDFSWKHKYVC